MTEPVAGKPKTPVRGVRISSVLWDAAKTKAASQGETVTAVIVRALTLYVHQPPEEL